MTYPDYYVGDAKENCIDENAEYEHSNRMRFSDTDPSYRRSFDEQAGVLKEKNYRYSEDSNDNKRVSKGRESERKHRNSQQSSASDNKGSRRGTTHSSKSASRHSKSTAGSGSRSSYDKTIALFGVNGITGHYFLQLAVEAGYHVRALIIPGFELEDMTENPNLTLIHGTMDDVRKVHRVIRKAAYVVCMLNDCPQPLESTPNAPCNFDFIQNLVPLMSECETCKVLLYQATSFATDNKGSSPMFTHLVKKMALRKTRRETLQEQDKIIRYISKYLKAREIETDELPFHYIVTRPSEIVWDRPSRRKLAASKSLPGPFPITNIDLAEFSLNALKMERLYNSCPYVVQDGI